MSEEGEAASSFGGEGVEMTAEEEAALHSTGGEPVETDFQARQEEAGVAVHLTFAVVGENVAWDEGAAEDPPLVGLVDIGLKKGFVGTRIVASFFMHRDNSG